MLLILFILSASVFREPKKASTWQTEGDASWFCVWQINIFTSHGKEGGENIKCLPSTDFKQVFLKIPDDCILLLLFFLRVFDCVSHVPAAGGAPTRCHLQVSAHSNTWQVPGPSLGCSPSNSWLHFPWDLLGAPCRFVLPGSSCWSQLCHIPPGSCLKLQSFYS